MYLGEGDLWTAGTLYNRYTSLGGFDTHSGQKDRLTERIGWLDTALGYFEREMKQRGMWGNVTIQIVSEFGRTNNNDNQGTDHAWAGHSFVVGGALKGGAGGRALGHYPPECVGHEASP
jgi:uncharacterized protein (DUF1501 family)